MSAEYKIDETTIKQLLDELAEMRFQLDALKLERDKIIDNLIPIEIQREIASVKVEFGEAISRAQEAITEYETNIKKMVEAHGQSVKSEHYQAVYTKGRTTWDSKGLTGYAVAHPEINAFQKTGNPSVSLRFSSDSFKK